MPFGGGTMAEAAQRGVVGDPLIYVGESGSESEQRCREVSLSHALWPSHPQCWRGGLGVELDDRSRGRA